jgi:decaprenylphospho-beta-D-ribofuranose 2-oxidase
MPRHGDDLGAGGRIGAPGRQKLSEDLERLTDGAVLCRGLGRSYGDSRCRRRRTRGAGHAVLADRILAFDPQRGPDARRGGRLAVAAEPPFLLPRLVLLPVTPGTQFVSLGGMVAADVHGKGHHRFGGFGAHLRALRLRVADGSIVTSAGRREPELFWATVGGMGLTGHILEVECQAQAIPTPWIHWQEPAHRRHRSRSSTRSSARARLAVLGRVDRLPVARQADGPRDPRSRALGEPRGRGGQAAAGTLRLRAVQLPELGARSSFTVQAFNTLSTGSTSSAREGLRHPDSFFYPLDAILHWNRIYGRRGFTQYQCVLPDSAGKGAARRFLELLTSRGGASFLCVIKDCGPQGQGLLSFLRRGSRSRSTSRCATTRSAGRYAQRAGDRGGRADLPRQGRLHPPRALRGDGPARWPAFQAVRDRWDPAAIDPVGAVGAGPRRPALRCARARASRHMKVVFLGATKGMGRALARLHGGAR